MPFSKVDLSLPTLFTRFWFLLFLPAFLVVQGLLLAQPPEHIQVAGRFILGPCGDTLTLRGINYAPYNWGWSPGELRISEIKKTKANATRLVWYKTGSGATPAATYADFVKLDTALMQCVRMGLIPILVLHDQTCQNNPAQLLSLASWYTQQPVKQLIQKYQHSLILNIANEALSVAWTANPAASQLIFFNTYKTIIENLRAAGIKVPIMIDGPECGTNLDVLAAIGPNLINADPEHNLIFSAHAYWFAYAGNDSTQMRTKISNALATEIPFVFGELANLQDDVANCQHSLNFKPLLRICQEKKLGWLAWSWDHDVCTERQVSSAGLFAQLSAYGQVIVHDPVTGLFSNPVPGSRFLTDSTCGFTQAKMLTSSIGLQIRKEAVQGWYSVFPEDCFPKIQAWSIQGHRLEIVRDGRRFFVPLHSGLVLVQLTTLDGAVRVYKIGPHVLPE